MALTALRFNPGRKEDRPVHLELGLAKGSLAAKFCRRWSQLGSTCCLVATRTRNRNAPSVNIGKRLTLRSARSVFARGLRCFPLRNVWKAWWIGLGRFTLEVDFLNIAKDDGLATIENDGRSASRRILRMDIRGRMVGEVNGVET